MTASLTCETATLADAVMRAARLAPTKGAAWDKAAGILIDVRPQHTTAPARIMATDLEVSYYQRITVVDCGDEDVQWRLPSQIISGYLANLPMSAGKYVELTQDGGYVKLKAGRSRSKFRTLPTEFYPIIKPFDPAGLVPVADFARRIEQIAWACATDSAPLTGIHIDGTRMIACDRYRIATMPCVVPVEHPVTAPLGPLSAVLRNIDDVLLRATDTRLEIMPNEDTQLTALVYAEPYPDLDKVLARATIASTVKVQRETLIEALARMLVLVKGERYPRLTVVFRESEAFLRMVLPETGEVEETIDISNGPTADVEIIFDPSRLLAAANNGMREVMSIGIAESRMHPTRLHDESGFDSWIMPMIGTPGT